jgi:RimJ/RimL family protein N-acetyltransferase
MTMTQSAAIETARLVLRPISREEAEHIAAGSRDGRLWSEGYPRGDDQDVARMFLGMAPPADPLFGPLQVVLLGSGTVIGGIGFMGPPDADGTVEIGYGVAPEAEGRGYTTEAVLALLHWAFTVGGCRRVIATTALDNHGSQRVLDKASLTLTRSDETLHHYEITRTTG